MVIKRSAGQETLALIADLDGEDDVRREAAIARLSVIGTRAVDRLVTTLMAPPAPSERTTVAALRALESIADIRALVPALSLLDSPHPPIGVAAVGVARNFLQSKHGNEVLDRFVSVAMNAERPDATRLAALDALLETGTRVLAPVWERLREDRSLAIQQRAAKETGGSDPLAEIEAAAAGLLPDDAEAFQALLRKTAATAPLTTLHRLIEVIRGREAAERPGPARTAWLSARGAVHAALAERDSRVALYDLRDSIADAPGPLPAPFLSAVTAIGDAASLEAIAAASAKASIAGGASEWLQQLKLAFRAIADREQLGSRHAVMKRIQAKWPGAAAELIKKK